MLCGHKTGAFKHFKAVGLKIGLCPDLYLAEIHEVFGVLLDQLPPQPPQSNCGNKSMNLLDFIQFTLGLGNENVSNKIEFTMKNRERRN